MTIAPDDPDIRCLLDLRADRAGAFEQLVARFAPVLFQFLLRQTGRREMAEDLTQDVFLRVFRARHRYEPRARPRTYLLTIATNVLCNQRRREGRRECLSLEDEAAVGSSAAPCAEDLQPMQALARAELQLAVRAAVASLPSNQRIAVDLLRFGELSYVEIAAAMALPLAAVKGLLHRAKESLRCSLRAQIDAAEPPTGTTLHRRLSHRGLRT